MPVQLKPSHLSTAGGKRAHSTDNSASATPVSEKNIVLDEVYLPPFLRQSHYDINNKFELLNKQQEERILHGRNVTDPEASPWHTDASRETRPKNRYMDIKPWTKTRVRLRVPEGNPDYINASPILLKCSQTGDERNYIAAQGPKDNTVSQFWQMVWDETGDIAVVVMLTQLFENNREKCYQYYPEDTASEPFAFNFLNDLGEEVQAVLQVKESIYDELSKSTQRTLLLSCNDQEKLVYHFSFLGWPDHGVPEDVDRSALLELIRITHERNGGWKNPRVVHCSAGVGRSGTFIALEYLLAELENGRLDEATVSDPSVDPVFATVDNLREQRVYMVQSDEQYHFLYESLAEAFRARAKERAIAAQVESKITQAGEPAHKAMRITRHLKSVFSNLRDRSSSRKGEERKKRGEKEDTSSLLSTQEKQDDRSAHLSDNLERTESAKGSSLPDSSVPDTNSQEASSPEASSYAETGLTQEAHRIRLGEEESDGANTQ